MKRQGAAVHPFPARMAPELISHQIAQMESEGLVLDPMMGSGSFIHAAAVNGMRAIGIDSDPLALLIARTAVDQSSEDVVLRAARRVVNSDPSTRVSDVTDDPETIEFIDYWFDHQTQRRIAGMIMSIRQEAPNLQDVLLCALSRMIITKDEGVSRARDVSHSRPHIVRLRASYDPLDRFEAAVKTVLSRRIALTDDEISRIHFLRGDARALPLRDNSLSAVMTSPPYLNAIDYLRGHRLSLVWMGYRIADLRRLRGESIGSERGADLVSELGALRDNVIRGFVVSRRKNVINRYLLDLDAVVREVERTLKVGGEATFVVADSVHGGTQISVGDAMQQISERHGLELVSRIIRELPAGRRYLPPPEHGSGPLALRMRAETILTFVKS